MDSSISTLWTDPFVIEGVSDQFLLLPFFTEIHVLYAHKVDPDKTSHSEVSDPGALFT